MRRMWKTRANSANHETMWLPFVPNTLPSPYEYRYPGWFFPIEISFSWAVYFALCKICYSVESRPARVCDWSRWCDCCFFGMPWVHLLYSTGSCWIINSNSLANEKWIQVSLHKKMCCCGIRYSIYSIWTPCGGFPVGTIHRYLFCWVSTDICFLSSEDRQNSR